MMYQTKRTCSRARGRSAWGCSRLDAMYTMSLHFMIKLFAPVVTYRKKTPQSIKSPREKNKRKNLYMCTRGSSTFWSFSRLAVQEPLRLPKPQVQFFVFYIPRPLTSSNTFFNPFCVNAEHSTYFLPPNSLANLSPCSCVINPAALPPL